jgi:hypothetical protein
MRICPQCNSQVLLQANICSNCALPLPENQSLDTGHNQQEDYNQPDLEENDLGGNKLEEKKICPSCKTNNDAKWAFCSFCGAPLLGVAVEKHLNQKPTAPNVINKIAKQSLQSVEEIILKHKEIKQTPTAPQEKAQESTKDVANSLKDLVFCIACGQANHKDTATCLSCQTPIIRTLAMGSQVSYPKLVLMKDSGETETYDITADEVTIGRIDSDISFPEDNYMSSLHARIICKNQKYFLIDEQSKNGIYKRIKKELTLTNGNIVLIGKQVFRFEVES